MKNNSFGSTVVAVLLLAGVLYMIGSVGKASEPECIKSGCENKQASGSSYCYLHKPYSGSSSSHNSSVYDNKSSNDISADESSSSSSYGDNSSTQSSSSYSSNSAKKSTTSKKSSYDSYDDGYDDIYMDGDYDYDRYDKDSDYADGVDDAMEEFGEDW